MPEAPDYIGLGAQSAGIVWWNDVIVAHPGVEPQAELSRHFFDDFCARPMEDADVEAYHAAFARPEGRLAGEWTARYMFDPWIPMLMRRVAPDAKLLMLLRDPVERYRAGLLDWIGRPPRGHEMHVVSEGIERGRYATQLRRILRHYPADQVLVQQYERCVREPHEEIARVYAFLGLDEGGAPADIRAPEPGPALPELWPDLETDLREIYAPEIEELTALVPDIDLELWPAAR